MSKQATLHNYMKTKNYWDQKKPNKPSKKEQRPKDDNSRECSQTDELPPQQYEVYGANLVCPSFILIGTSDTIIYDKVVRRNINLLLQNYSRSKFFDFLEDNLKYHNIKNIKNLEDVIDDQFWNKTLPFLIQMILKDVDKISACIRRLPKQSTQVISITRHQILLILVSMFLGIFPKQLHESVSTFGNWMTISEYDIKNPSKIEAKRSKLLCVINYFKVMAKQQSTYEEVIQIQRTNISPQSWENNDYNSPLLRSVTFSTVEESTIEDHYGKSIMVDFANKHIGGGVLGNGCVQEEIMFVIFPEMIVTRFVCEELEEKEAVLVYGAKRFNLYEGYSDSFRFKGTYKGKVDASKSIIAVIDAVNFGQFLSSGSNNAQYSKKYYKRQINKAYAAFLGAEFQVGDTVNVCTGRWGCGAFKGDEDYKFLIQWVACSLSQREMLYIGANHQKIKQYALLVKEFTQNDQINKVEDVLAILEQYYHLRLKTKNPINILEYIKNFVI